MDFEQLNNTIKNYLDNDKTNSAIMLTGEWGSGKSYYIRNELLPYIEKDGDKKCIVVSLYGISDIAEINKNIYANINEFFMLEKPYLEQLKQGLEELLKQGAFEDKIKANQIKWFISNLENFILKLNK